MKSFQELYTVYFIIQATLYLLSQRKSWGSLLFIFTGQPGKEDDNENLPILHDPQTF
jgi:hypothetical protein